MAGRKQVNADVKRWDMTVIRFRLVDEEAEAFKEMLGKQSIQDYFEKHVKDRIAEYAGQR